MAKQTPKARVEELRRALEEANYRYYILDDPTLEEARGRHRDIMMATVDSAKSTGWGPGVPTEMLATIGWAAMHGLAVLQREQSIAKLYGGVKANEIVDRVLQIHGGMGYTRELPVERWYRELRLLRIYEGTDEIQRRTIARNLLKGHASVSGTLG